jgi:hypothetical protein
MGSEDGFGEGEHMPGKLKPLDVERETRSGKHSDGDGLYLIVARKNGKQRWLGSARLRTCR